MIVTKNGVLNKVKLTKLSWLVQSLNSPFYPPHIGAEPGRAKEESRITCMRMLRTPLFPPPPQPPTPPKIGGKPIFGSIFPDLACGPMF